jgi:acetyl esterase/lipase
VAGLSILGIYFMIKLLAYFFFIFFTLHTSYSFAMPSGIKVLSDISYGDSKKQVMDVYYPSYDSQDAPVIFMVHGGAWRIGDKASKGVVKNKVAHWVSKGFIFISINYRLIPEAYPIEQAKDVEKALLFAKKNIIKWGGSPEKFILIGHSAGAHLVSLLSVRHDVAIKPWLGTVALDSAAYDIEKIMRSPSPPRLYKKAFGKNSTYWKNASPIHALNHKLFPFLAICSSKRKDSSCSQAGDFVEKAKLYGTQAQLMPVDYSHRDINIKLGVDYCYTQSVDNFIKKLHPTIETMLTSQSKRTQHSCSGV